MRLDIIITQAEYAVSCRVVTDASNTFGNMLMKLIKQSSEKDTSINKTRQSIEIGPMYTHI